jgi:hypothetical protein
MTGGNGSFQQYIGGANLPFPLPVIAGRIAGGLLSAVAGAIALRRLQSDYQAMVFLVISLNVTAVVTDWCYVLVAGRVELNDAPAALRARPDFGELFLGRSARTQQPAAPARHPPQATTGPAVTAAGAHQASHEEG